MLRASAAARLVPPSPDAVFIRPRAPVPRSSCRHLYGLSPVASVDVFVYLVDLRIGCVYKTGVVYAPV